MVSGVMVYYSLFWTPLREVVFGLVGQPVGEIAARIPRGGATLTPGVCQGGKTGLVLGDFKFHFRSCILAYRAPA